VGGGDATVIIDNTNHTGDGDAAMLGISSNATGAFRMSGMTIRGGGNVNNHTTNGAMHFGGQSKQFRVDHVHFDQNNQIAFSTYDWIYGVFDHNTIDGVTGSGWRDNAASWNGQVEGDGSWADDTTLGSNRFLFYEDNIFNKAGNDCQHGARFVLRHNAFTDADTGTHPTGGAGRARGCRAWEIYQNTFSATASRFDVFFASAGTGVIWNNTAPTGYSNFVTVHSMRRNNTTYPETGTPADWGYCGTSFNGTGSNWDQNTVASAGYACLDQVARGKGDLISGSFPNAVNTRTGTIAWPQQALEPVYEWLNNVTVSSAYWAVYDAPSYVENQDYYLYTASFNGSSGSGSGLLSARPSTCTTGVAYWATDQGNWNQSGSGGQGQLFVCTSTNTWTLYYTPYTYPHPLISGASGSLSVAPPTNLTATVK
jgi:hypothetical protein